MIQLRSRIVYGVGVSLVLAALGCQVPGTSGAPRVSVVYNSFQWSNDTDLAIKLDFRALLGKGGYSLKAVPGGTPTLRRLVAKVTGANIVGELTATVYTAECPDGIATFTFANLPPGPVHVVVNAFGEDDQTIVSWGQGDVVIVPNSTATVPVTCAAANGALNILFNCPELCGGIPLPSPTPTPIPTPTPSPVDVSGYLGGLATLNADAQGNLYLLGNGLGTENAKTSLVQIPNVNPNATANVLSHGVLDPMGDGEFFNGHLFVCQGAVGGQPNATVVEFDNNFSIVGQYAATTFGVITKDVDGSLVSMVSINTKPNTAPVIATVAVPRPTPFTFKYSQSISAIEHPARGSVVGGSSPAVIWTSASGIWRANPHQLLVPTTTTLSPLGLTGTGADSSLILYTNENDTRIYSVDAAVPGSSSEAFDVKDLFPANARIFPRDISIGEDGKYYVAVYAPTAPTIMNKPLGWFSGTAIPFKVFRFELDRSGSSARLVNPFAMAKSHL
jgi:hypothetical protein